MTSRGWFEVQRGGGAEHRESCTLVCVVASSLYCWYGTRVAIGSFQPGRASCEVLWFHRVFTLFTSQFLCVLGSTWREQSM